MPPSCKLQPWRRVLELSRPTHALFPTPTARLVESIKTLGSQLSHHEFVPYKRLPGFIDLIRRFCLQFLLESLLSLNLIKTLAPGK